MTFAIFSADDFGSFNKQHTSALIGSYEHDASGFEGTLDLYASRLMNAQTAVGFEAFESGLRYEGLFSQRFLCPTKQRPRGPNLSGGDHGQITATVRAPDATNTTSLSGPIG